MHAMTCVEQRRSTWRRRALANVRAHARCQARIPRHGAVDDRAAIDALRPSSARQRRACEQPSMVDITRYGARHLPALRYSRAQPSRQRRQVERAEAVMRRASARRPRRRRAGPACRISAWRCGRSPCPRRSPGTRRDRARNCAARSDAPCRSRESPASPRPRRSGSRPCSRRHWMSTSSDGSVNGKNDGRKRIFTWSTSKNALQNSSQDPFQVAEMRALVDHQPLDLMEHRRVGLVGVDAIGAARDDDADRRLLRSAWCGSAPARCACAAAAASRPASG